MVKSTFLISINLCYKIQKTQLVYTNKNHFQDPNRIMEIFFSKFWKKILLTITLCFSLLSLSFQTREKLKVPAESIESTKYLSR